MSTQQSLTTEPSLGSNQSISIKAYAKFNFFLTVAKHLRPDGYHDIESLVIPISLHDDLTLTPINDDPSQPETPPEFNFTCSDPDLGSANNLVVKAVQLFIDIHQPDTLSSFELHLEKRIPTEAGLGGGSSDAAATLHLLNQWFGLPFTVTQLVAMAAELGSDVPACVLGGLVHMVGRGEMVKPLPLDPTVIADLNNTPLLVIKPPIGISTPTAYAQLDEIERDHHRCPIRPTTSLNPWPDWDELLHNDFHQPVFNSLSELECLAHICQTCGIARYQLSGSGSAVIIFLDPDDPDTQTEQIKNSLKAALEHDKEQDKEYGNDPSIERWFIERCSPQL